MGGEPGDGHPENSLSAIGQALAILGDRWVLLILQGSFLLHVRTFARWRDELSISESVLSSRLKELVANGILATAAYGDGRTRFEYRLTDRGLTLWSLLLAIYSWEQDWTKRPLPPLIHDSCGAEAQATLGCGECHEPMSTRDAQVLRGPMATFAGIGRPRQHRRTVQTEAAAGVLGYCPDAMEILGDRWSTTVLASALLGTSRFVDFQAELAIAPSVLSHRLRRFVELDVFRLADGDYRLTDKGLAFFRVFAFLVDWAQRELVGLPGSDLAITHRPCGADLTPVLLCGSCGDPLQRRVVHFELGS